VVAVGRRILPKAETEAEARACLALMSAGAQGAGRCPVGAAGKGPDALVETVVRFKRLEPSEIESYLRAGGGAARPAAMIQGRAATSSLSSPLLHQCSRIAVFETGQLLKRGVVSRANRLIVTCCPGLPDGVDRGRPPGRAADRRGATGHRCRRRDSSAASERVMPDLEAASSIIGTGRSGFLRGEDRAASTAGRRPGAGAGPGAQRRREADKGRACRWNVAVSGRYLVYHRSARASALAPHRRRIEARAARRPYH